MKVGPARPGEAGGDLFTQLVQSDISTLRAITKKHQVEYQRRLGGLAVAWVLTFQEQGSDCICRCVGRHLQTLGAGIQPSRAT